MTGGGSAGERAATACREGMSLLGLRAAQRLSSGEHPDTLLNSRARASTHTRTCTCKSAALAAHTRGNEYTHGTFRTAPRTLTCTVHTTDASSLPLLAPLSLSLSLSLSSLRLRTTRAIAQSRHPTIACGSHRTRDMWRGLVSSGRRPHAVTSASSAASARYPSPVGLVSCGSSAGA